jgi:hypothetical protein
LASNTGNGTCTWFFFIFFFVVFLFAAILSPHFHGAQLC